MDNIFQVKPTFLNQNETEITSSIMKIKNLLYCLFFRPWLGVPFGIGIVMSIVYYWWLLSRISVLETQNKVFKTQLRISQNVLKQMSVDSVSTYEVPVVS